MEELVKTEKLKVKMKSVDDVFGEVDVLVDTHCFNLFSGARSSTLLKSIQVLWILECLKINLSVENILFFLFHDLFSEMCSSFTRHRLQNKGTQANMSGQSIKQSTWSLRKGNGEMSVSEWPKLWCLFNDAVLTAMTLLGFCCE